MKRRQFFKNSLPLFALPSLISSVNSDNLISQYSHEYTNIDVFENDKILVYVNLMGGLDACDILMPFDSYDDLAQKRPNLINPKLNYKVLNDTYGMHPNLSAFADMFKSQKLDVYTNIGSEGVELHHSLSLNEALLFDGRNTWLNRFASNFEKGNTIIEGINCNTQFICNNSNYKYVELEELSFQSQLKYILNELKKGTATKVFVINISGFDTHEDQTVKLENLYEEMSSSLNSFHTEIEKLGMEDRVSTILFSEMGRSIEENATGGTEHAFGASALLMGNGASGIIYNPVTMVTWTNFYSEVFNRLEFNNPEVFIS